MEGIKEAKPFQTQKKKKKREKKKEYWGGFPCPPPGDL